MTTLSVFGCNKPQSYKMKGSNGNPKNTKENNNKVNNAFNKITVQNVLSDNNTNSLNIFNNTANTIVRKIKDFGMFGTVNNAATKSTTKHILSSKNTLTLAFKRHSGITNDVNFTKKTKIEKISNTQKLSKKIPRQCLSVQKTVSGSGSKPAGTPGRKGLPLPQAVARRNARERNRVKQVNNGFAALRQRIPEEVAKVFETQSNNRVSAKKLSKVETLRMAVEYIRSLERLLGFDFPVTNTSSSYSMCSAQGSSSGDDSFVLIKDEFDELSHIDDENNDDSLSNCDMNDYFSTSTMNISYDESLANQIEVLPNITTLNGLQYLRIPGTNTYQLLTNDIFMRGNEIVSNQSVNVENLGHDNDNHCHRLVPKTSTSDNDSTPENNRNNLIAIVSPAPQTYADCINMTSSTLLPSTLVPHFTSTTANTLLHVTQQKNTQSVSLPPAYNDHLLRTCATYNLNEEPRFKAVNAIKEEFNENIADSQTSSAQSETCQRNTSEQNELSTQNMSPPLDRISLPQVSNAPGIQAFYEQDQSASFYEGVVSFKQELNTGLLDTSAATTALSDESMIEAIDWWEAHTPKSDGGSVIL